MRTRLLALAVIVPGLIANGQTPPPATIEFLAPVPVSEVETQAVVTVVRKGSLTNAVTVDFATTNHTAVVGLEYVATSGTLTFSAGETNKTFSVPLLNDGLREFNKLFRLDLSNPGGGAVLGVRTTIYVAIVDNDPGFSIWSSTPTVSEDVGQAYVTVNRGNDLNATVTVNYSTTGVSATPGTDYAAVSGTLTFAAGETSRVIVIPIVNDGLKETSETFRLQLSSPSPGTSLGSPNLTTITVQDNDPGFEFELGSHSVAENGGQVIVNVRRQDDLNSTATIDYYTTNWTATAGADYTASFGTLTFIAGETAKQIAIPVLNDALFEGNESFNVRLANPTGGAALGNRQIAGVTIRENDSGLEFTQPQFQTAENRGDVMVTVQRRDDSNTPATVELYTAPGAATPGADYTPVSKTLTFAVGESIKQILVPLINDAVVEGNEAFGLLLTNAVGSFVGSLATATVVIEENDSGFQVVDGPVEVWENIGAASINVRRDGDLTDAATVDYSTVPRAATPDSDYVAVSGTLNFGVGEMARLISIPIINDGFRESTENFVIILTNAAGGTPLGPVLTQEVRIHDNDEGFSIRDGRTPRTVREDQGEVVLIVQRKDDLNVVATVDFATYRWLATEGADYIATSGTLVFQPGETSHYIVVPIINDAIRDPDESFSVRLSNPTGGTSLGSPTTVGIYIADNETGVELVTVNPTVEEDAGSALIDVARGSDSADTVTVDYFTRGDTATAGSDYVETSGTLTFGPGESIKYLSVAILNDGVQESSEFIRIYLTNVVGGAGLGAGRTAALAIVDNDGGLSIANAVVNEKVGSTQLILQRGNDGAFPIAFDYTVSGGTAVQGRDYTLSAGGLDFPVGATTRTIPLTVIDDPLAEGDETIELTLVNVATGETNLLAVTIQDDEAPVVVDVRFVPDLPEATYSPLVARQPNGQLIVAYRDLERVYDQRVMRLNLDGSRDPGLNALIPNQPMNALVLQADGKFLCGAEAWGNPPLFRLNADGTRDVTFSPGLGLDVARVSRIAVQPDQNIVVGYHAPNRLQIARLKPDGSRDNTFGPVNIAPAYEFGLLEMILQPDGQLLLGGSFTNVNGLARAGLARLNTDGSVDNTFSPLPAGEAVSTGVQVGAIALQTDNKLLVGVNFAAQNGVSVSRLTRLNPDGSLDATFDPLKTTNSWIGVVVVQPDGRVLVAGSGLDPMDPTPRLRGTLVRLLPDGRLDTSLVVSFEQLAPDTIVLEGGNTALITGYFESLNGIGIEGLARIFIDNTGLKGALFEASEYEVSENSGLAALTVRRLGDVDGSLNIGYATSNGTAIAGADFQAQTSTLTFGPFERAKTILVPILNDGTVEDPESFTVTLKSSTPDVIVGERFPAVVHLLDNEVPALVDRSFNPVLGGVSFRTF